MKNGVECYKDFFPYFKALKTNCASFLIVKISSIIFYDFFNCNNIPLYQAKACFLKALHYLLLYIITCIKDNCPLKGPIKFYSVAVHKRGRNFLNVFDTSLPSPCRNFEPDLPNFYLIIFCNIRISDPLPHKIFRRLLWMVPLRKLQLHRMSFWVYMLTQLLKSFLKESSPFYPLACLIKIQSRKEFMLLKKHQVKKSIFLVIHLEINQDLNINQ